MIYPSLPQQQEQEEMFRRLEKVFETDHNIVISPIKSWSEYEGRLKELNKLEDDNN